MSPSSPSLVGSGRHSHYSGQTKCVQIECTLYVNITVIAYFHKPFSDESSTEYGQQTCDILPA